MRPGDPFWLVRSYPEERAFGSCRRVGLMARERATVSTMSGLQAHRPGWSASAFQPRAERHSGTQPREAHRIHVVTARRAARRAAPIGSPQATQLQYSPSAGLNIAASMSARCWRARLSKAVACWRSNASVAFSGTCTSSAPAEPRSSGSTECLPRGRPGTVRPRPCVPCAACRISGVAWSSRRPCGPRCHRSPIPGRRSASSSRRRALTCSGSHRDLETTKSIDR